MEEKEKKRKKKYLSDGMGMVDAGTESADALRVGVTQMSGRKRKEKRKKTYLSDGMVMVDVGTENADALHVVLRMDVFAC